MEYLRKSYKAPKRTLYQRDVILFSIFFSLYPILCLYKAVLSFTVGDVILFIFMCYSFSLENKIDKRSSSVLAFATYALFFYFLQLELASGVDLDSFFSRFMRLAKFILYMFCVFNCSKICLDYDKVKKCIIYIALIACLFIIVQYWFFYISGKVILGHIPGLPLYLEEYATIDYMMFYNINFRPSSIFLEPAMFSQFMCVPLIFVLYDESFFTKRNKILICIFFVLCMLLSTSGQCVIYIVAIMLGYMLNNSNNLFKTLCFFLFLTLLFYVLYLYITPISMAVDRLLFNEDASNARMGTYFECYNLDIFHMLFGYGYGTTPNGQWMAGLAYVWYGCGLIGLMLVFRIFYMFYKMSENIIAKNICLIFFIMFTGTGLFYNYMLFWFFSLMTIRFESDVNAKHKLY